MKTMYSLVAMLLVMVSVSYAQPLEVTNGGFEGGIVDGWGMEMNDGATGEFLEEMEDAQEGTTALKIYVDALGPNDWSSQIKNETWTVAKGKSYKLSIWAKDISEGDDTCYISFTAGMTNAVDTWIEGSRMDYQVLSKEWKEYSIYFTPAAESIDAGLFAYQSTHFVQNTGVCLIDNFTVTETQTIGGSIAEGGTSAIIEFVSTLSDPTGNEANFEVVSGGVANPVTAIALDETDLNKVILTLTNAVAETDNVVITYTPGSLTTSAGTEITEFSLTFSGAVSIFENSVKQALNVYPNPATDVVYFDAIENVNSVEVYNVAGKLIHSESTMQNSLNVTELEKGIYFLVVRTNDGMAHSSKVMVE